MTGEGLAVGDGGGGRSGEDGRRRGWYWHWNELVTQYAPLIGLKGVGLLNSYTVWTDRREASPHRGYAFPSQQSEADFYGEDRAELIAINKILVALDLIEIRKEMVLRADAQGRRWRVPHNFYRVKDHADGFTISTREVLKVAVLADRDKAVYRYVRRVFSPRFSPIDGENPWHRILPELRETELWRRLGERAAQEEDRASARTRAGHAARRANAEGSKGERRASGGDAAGADVSLPAGGDAPTTSDRGNDSSTDDTLSATAATETAVATSNEGSGSDVGGDNNGFDHAEATSVDGGNDGAPTAVDPTNTTYDQAVSTTTTTGGSSKNTPADPPPSADGGANRPATIEDAVRAFEEANDRPATPAERNLLRGLAERFDLAALAAAELDPAAPDSGWGWVAAAVYEAVEAGSAFVAPRRLREILLRWEREGYPPSGGEGRGAEERGAAGPAPAQSGGRAARATDRRPAAADLIDDGPDLPLPHGHGGRRTWAFVVGLLGSVLDREPLAGLVGGTAIVGYRDGEVTIAAPQADQAARLATTHRELVERKLGEAMRRPVRLAVVTTEAGSPERGSDGGSQPAPGRAPRSGGERGAAPRPAAVAPRRVAAPRTRDAEPPAAELRPATFLVAEVGLASDQVWAAVLGELDGGGAVGRATFDAWLRGTALLGRAAEGGAGSALIVGAPNPLAQRRLSERLLPALEDAVARVVGRPLPITIVVARDWLADAVTEAASIIAAAPAADDPPRRASA